MEHSDRQPSRRDVLGGKLPGGDSVEGTNQETAEFGPLFHFSSNAMGCQFQVLCSADSRQALANAVSDGFDLIQHLEQHLSIFRDSSELYRVNRHASQQDVQLDSSLFDLLLLACQMSAVTDGAFDITATPLTQLWKSHRTERTLPTSLEIEATLNQVGYRHIHFDASARTVRFHNHELKIDLGGIGKGYALDRLKQYLVAAGCTDFLIHGGQSSVIGCGQRSNLEETTKHPWQVSISHPLTPDTQLARLMISDRAIGTSGSGRKHFVVEGQRYGHIIDPRTGWPADHLSSVTVVADSAVLADALATAIFVAGPEQAQGICDLFGVAAVLVSNEGMIESKINLAEEDIRLE